MTRAMRYPFGVPDGTPQEGSSDPLGGFVRVRGDQFSLGLGMAADDRTARVIVGRKGSGKTLYLRRLQKAARGDSSLYADAWQTDHPPTSEVIRVYDLASGATDVTELWERIWRRALFRCAASHLLCAPRLRAAVEPVAAELDEILAGLDCHFNRPSPPSHQVEEIIFGHRYAAELNDYLNRPAWRRLEAAVTDALQDSPPMCFYLDALDENFERAPRQWLACQLGLCRLVLRMADQFPRLHVVIAIRDLVYSALLAGEHRTRYVRRERIRTLDWNESAINRLLREKIEQLPEAYLRGADTATSPVERWLGLREIMNHGQSEDRAGKREDAREYLLRHTRLIPRDLVQLGNALCDVIDKAADEELELLPHDELHAAVSTVARDAGREELVVVANHITTFWRTSTHKEAWSNAHGDAVSDDERSLQSYIAEDLRALLRPLQVDRVPREAFQGFLENVRRDFGDIDIGSVLWQHGLLGYIDGPTDTGEAVFFSAFKHNDMTLSLDHDAYAFHPIMIDTVPLVGVGNVVRTF